MISNMQFVRENPVAAKGKILHKTVQYSAELDSRNHR